MKRLTKLDEDVIDLDELDKDEVVGGTVGTNCLAGRLALVKAPNMYYLLDVMKKTSRVKKPFSAREWGPNLFLFRFGTKEEMKWVIRRQLWHFDGHLFVIAPLVGSEQPSSIIINHVSFWVRAYDLPINCLNNQTAKALASKMGTYEEMDESVDEYVGNYLQFKVAIDIREPLLRGLNLKLSGNQFWVGLKYESLPIFCYNCKIIDHLQKQCPRGGFKTYQNKDDIPYGPRICVSPLKRERFNRVHRFAPNSKSARSLFFPDPVPKTNLQSKSVLEARSEGESFLQSCREL